MAVNSGMIRAVARDRRRIMEGRTRRRIYCVPPLLEDSTACSNSPSSLRHRHDPFPLAVNQLQITIPLRCFASRITPQDVLLLKALPAIPDRAAEESSDGFRTPEAKRRSDDEEVQPPNAPARPWRPFRIPSEEEWEY